MKKLLSTMLAVTIMLSAVGCSSTNEELETSKETSDEIKQTIISNPITSIQMTHETFDNSRNMYDLESDKTDGSYWVYKTDLHGTVYGPEDYAIENDTVYILNSSNNSILVCKENFVAKNITLQDFIATHIAVVNGTLYTVGTNMKVYRIDDSTPHQIIDISTISTADDISDFKIIENILMITTPEGDYCKTYSFDLTDFDSDKKTVPMVIDGRMIGKEIYYYTLPLTEGDQLISNICKLIIHYPDSTYEEVIIESVHGLVGVELLAIKNDTLLVLISEVYSDSNNNIVYEKSLQYITKQGSTESSYLLPAQFKSIDNPVKMINNHIYFLHNDISYMQIEILDEILLSNETEMN